MSQKGGSVCVFLRIRNALEGHLSAVNNRMNEAMKMLTIITSLFMPISFLVGFLGMNGFQPSTPLGVWISSHVLVLTLIAMILVSTERGSIALCNKK